MAGLQLGGTNGWDQGRNFNGHHSDLYFYVDWDFDCGLDSSRGYSSFNVGWLSAN